MKGGRCFDALSNLSLRVQIQVDEASGESLPLDPSLSPNLLRLTTKRRKDWVPKDVWVDPVPLPQQTRLLDLHPCQVNYRYRGREMGGYRSEMVTGRIREDEDGIVKPKGRSEMGRVRG